MQNSEQATTGVRMG